jgi:hypothetical protein
MPKLPLRLSSDLVLQIRAYCQKRQISVESYIRGLVSLDLEMEKLISNDESLPILPEWDKPLDLPEWDDHIPSNW